MQAGPALGAMIFAGIFVPGLNRASYLANPSCRVETYFMTLDLKRDPNKVDFLPLCYGDILLRLRAREIAAALFTVSPPDANGICSFGTTVDFLADLWPKIPCRIAQINPLMPRTAGHRGIPYNELTAVMEAQTPLLGLEDEPLDKTSEAIGTHAAAWVPDGATLQIGLGKIPGAILRALHGHRGLRVHSGLIGDAVLDLALAGALAPGVSVHAGVAIGSHRLYDAVGAPEFAFYPVSYTHNPEVLARLTRFVTFNSALSVDLFGQVYAEFSARGLMSGPGGAVDFARGAKAAGGLRVIALPAAANGGAASRIVPVDTNNGPVSLGRMDVDIVVTEHGAADLRGLGHDARARALACIAAPLHREELLSGWHDYAKNF